MADVEGLNLKITADASQGVKAVGEFAKATEQIKDQTVEIKVEGKMDSLGKLHKANGQFMTMGEKMAAQFNSAFMKSISEWSVKLDSFGKSLETKSAQILKPIIAGLTAVSSVVALVTKNALSIGGGFEAQMTNVKIISGATTQELDALTKKAREMGATLPITAKDAAQAMELLAQRGTKAKDILASVADVSALAISQNIDMATAADLLGTTITNFGLSVEDASKITDIFNNASNQSAMNISKLVAAMKYVGPAAGALEIPLEKIVAAMEAAANAGLTGEMIGTGLSMTLTKLASSSYILGVNTRNLDGSMRTLDEIFTDLAKRGMTAADANNIFGQRAGKTAIALAKHSATLLENEKNVQKWGATQNAVIEKMKTWPNIWNSFQSALEEVHIEIFDQIKEQSKNAISSVANLTRTFSEWINKTQLAGKTLNSFLEGLGFRIPGSSDFKKLLDTFDVQAFLNKIKNFGASIKGIADSIVSFFNMVKTPLKFLIENLSTFATISFWGWIIGKGAQVPIAIMSLATAFLTLYNNLKLITSLNLTNLIALLSNPVTITIGTVAGVGLGIKYLYDEAKEAQKLKDEKIKIQREVEKLNYTATIDVNFKMATGFENIPESLSKATQELQDSLNENITAMQNVFKEKIAESTNEVTQNLENIKDKAKITANDITDAIATLYSKALHADINAFEELDTVGVKIVELLNETVYRTGKAYEQTKKLVDIYKKVNKVKNEALAPQKTEADFFSEDISSNLKNVLSNIKPEIERFKKLLGGNNIQLAVNVSLDEAQKNIKEFIKKISEERKIPEKLVEQGVFNQLKTLAAQGSNVAQSLVNGFEGASTELDNFISKSQDMINYLGASPQKFLPALNSLAKNIQKIDPVTGKITEDFKKAHDALKQWSNITFDKLTKRIQNMRKAVEGGFLDKSALEREYKNALSQITLQVKTELEPTRDLYKTQSNYDSVFASEVYSRMFELGGDVFADKMKQDFQGQTGAAMGHALAVYLKKELNGDNAPIFKVNGIKQETQQINDRNNEIFNLQQVAQTFDNIATRIENINIQAPAAPVARDYTSSIAQVVNEIKILNNSMLAVENAVKALNITQNVDNTSENNNVDLAPVISLIQNLVQVNTNNSSQIVNAVNNLNNATTNNYNIDIHQEGFNIQKKSDADSLARSTAGAIRTGLGNGGV